MRSLIPDECLLALPAQITPELAATCSEKMGLLFQVQLLGRSIGDVESALTLLVDLARDLVPYDKAALLWRDDLEGSVQIRSSRGFGETLPTGFLRELFTAAENGRTTRPFLLSPPACPPYLAESLRRKTGAACLLLMPLYTGERVMGALVLLRDGVPGFGLSEAHLLRVFAFSFETILDNLLHGGETAIGSFSDPLTGVFNRRYFEQQLEREVDRARRGNDRLSILLTGVDDFFPFRQKRGRAASEALLHDVVRGFGQVCRRSDTVARFGEEVFACILPGADKHDAAAVAGRTLEAMGQLLPAGTPSGTGRSVTYSLSSVSYPEDGATPEFLIESCLHGLEKARAMGGTRLYQYPSTRERAEGEEILDAVRFGMIREPLQDSGRLLELFARLCLDAVPADRASIMVREGEFLSIRVAIGFGGREALVRSERVPLLGPTVSAWVAQSLEPLLVQSAAEMKNLVPSSEREYRGDSFFSFPLLDGAELVGVAHFSNRSDGQPFTVLDIDGFRPVGSVMARYLSAQRRFGTSQEGFLREALYALVEGMESQIPGMERHAERVASLVQRIAAQLGHGEEEILRLMLSSRLHDIGVLAYRVRTLGEPRALSPRERSLAQRHPLLGWQLLKELPVGEVDRDAILYHHEREDGSGYFGKKASDTPQAAKILAVADVFQALVSSRPYRPALSKKDALAYIEAQKGILFDPRVVEALERALREQEPQAVTFSTLSTAGAVTREAAPHLPG
jgi:diguanylate cyclase (GGDEF)-like protein